MTMAGKFKWSRRQAPARTSLCAVTGRRGIRKSLDYGVGVLRSDPQTMASGGMAAESSAICPFVLSLPPTFSPFPLYSDRQCVGYMLLYTKLHPY